MNKYKEVYVNDVNEFYIKFKEGRHFSTIKFYNESNYHKLLSDLYNKKTKDYIDWLIIGEILLLTYQKENEIPKIVSKIKKVKDSRVYNYLYKIYNRGFGVKHNLKVAMEYLKKAVDLNDAIACYNLWASYYNGFIDIENPLSFLEKAAELEDPISQELLGNYYDEQGFAVKAKYWWQRAKQNGNNHSKLKLILLNLEDFNYEINPKTIIYEMISLAESGNINSQVELAIKFLEGVDVKQNIGYAFNWFNVAAKNGSEKSKKYLNKYFGFEYGGKI